MLLVWLFALTSSVVHACNVTVELHGRAPAVANVDADAKSTSTASHSHCHEAATLAQEQGAPADAGSPCAKFCDDESVGAPTAKPQAEPPAVLWLAPPPSAAVAFQTVRQPIGSYSAEPGRLYARVPIPIAFLRLTL